MSDIKRYVCFYDTFMEAESQEDVNGEWVKYEDYALHDAEYERLRKAGDAVSLCLEAYWKGKPYDVSMTIKCLEAWNAAKDGKPSV